MKRLCTLIFVLTCLFNHTYAQSWKQYLDSANKFYDLRKFDSAVQYYIKAKNGLNKDSSVTNSYAGICNLLGVSFYYIGEYSKAEIHWIEAKQIREKTVGKGNLDYASSCYNLALLYYKIGLYKKAEPLYIEAKNIREKVLGKDDPKYANTCNNIAVLYSQMGQYEKAELLWREAKRIWEKAFGVENLDYAATCNNLAILYKNMGQYEKAESLYIEALKIKEKKLGKEDTEYANSCNNLANLYADMGQFEKAESLYVEAKSIQEKALGKDDPEYATSCDNLAILYAEMRQFKKAELLYFEAKNIRERVLGKENLNYATSCFGLANLFSDLGLYERAQPLYMEAQEIWKKLFSNEYPDYALSCNNLAILYWAMGLYEKAEAYYLEALHLQQGQIKKLFQFTSEAEKQSYLKNIAGFKKYYLSFKTTAWSPLNQGFTYDVSLTNRNLILSSSQQLRNSIYSSNDTSIKNKCDNWINSREQIAFWNAKPIADRPSYIKELEAQANTLEKELTRLSSDFKNQQQKKEVTWKKIQLSLKTNEAAIEFIEFRYSTGKRWTDSTYYIALVLRKDKPEPILVRLFEKKQLDKLLNNTENLAINSKINTLYKGNKSLYNLTWKPLEKYLAGISKVYFASAGNLFKISFAALPVNDMQVLGDKYQLVQLNTTATVTDNTQNFITVTDKIQLYGGIKYDADSATLKQAVAPYQTNAENVRSLPSDLERGAGFQYLPGTQKETESIKKEIGNTGIPVTILSGTNATEESVKALTGKKSPSVLHIATHGFFFPDPKDDKRDSIQQKFETSGKVFKQSDNPLFRSGLLFAGANNAWQGKPIAGIEDGILTSYEVSNLYLPNTKLVVLSACETALGDIQGSEGVYGLQRAFKMAGVQNLVMSLWKVPDAETAEFMQLFYKNLFAKQTISNAFYNAQEVMKNKYRADPYKWAAWVLVR